MLYNSANFNTDYYVFFFACIDTHIKIPDNGMEDGIRRSQQQGRQQLLLRRPRVSVFVFRRILANYFLPPNFLL